MEEGSPNGFHLIDMVRIEIGACNFSSPPKEYTGRHGIATITLAYTITTTIDDYKLCIEPSES